MNYSRDYHTASILTNGKVLITGGEDLWGPLGTAELYDPSTGTWATTGNMTYVRQCHTASTLKNGKVLITGGDNYEILNSAELY
ncbi:unnamed protein product [Rotaria sp. Silwood1]|nr:unnamed protein product [Rotaria sp. Silwood1]